MNQTYQKPLRVLVCGGRDFADRDKLFNFLYDFCQSRGLVSEPDEYGNWLPNGLTIIHGAARGADRIADHWAVVNWVPVEAYPANWDKYPKAAGPIRNRQMLDTGVDVVIAFSGGKGTAHMKSIASKAGIEVIDVSEG